MNKELLTKLINQLKEERKEAEDKYNDEISNLRRVIMEKVNYIFAEIEPLRALTENDSILIKDKFDRIINCTLFKEITIRGVRICSKSERQRFYIYGSDKRELNCNIKLLDEFIANRLNEVIENYLINYNQETEQIKQEI